MLQENCEDLTPWEHLQSRLVLVYAALPSLFRRINDHTASDVGLADFRVEAWNVRCRLLDLDSIVQDILADASLVRESTSTCKDSPYRTCYNYLSLLVAQPLLLYWRILIIVNNTIQQLGLEAENDETLHELNASSLSAAHHIASSAEDIRRWTPIASIITLFNLPAAIWVLSRSTSYGLDRSKEAEWLSVLMEEYTQPLDKSLKDLIETYLRAVGLKDKHDMTETHISATRKPRLALPGMNSPARLESVAA